jgi:hypothetical protein
MLSFCNHQPAKSNTQIQHRKQLGSTLSKQPGLKKIQTLNQKSNVKCRPNPMASMIDKNLGIPFFF